MKNTFTPVIGLEVHIELSTKSKMFCSCPADHFAKAPNSQVCPVCLGLPGALPYPNLEAINSTIKLGLSFGTEISMNSKFDRKHYFYPDLPKGYQISQYDLPLCRNGEFRMEGWESSVKIRRIHLEEDTGKLVHSEVDGKRATLVDFNRSGVPLVELVTEPIIGFSVEEILEFLKEIQRVVRYLEISNADMEKGGMRLEANISVQKLQNSKTPKLATLPDYKVELKNINSFSFLQNALYAEISRQTKLIESGGKPVQETRGYNEITKKTFSQRTKEEAQDYRYFPEPDIAPIAISNKDIKLLESTLPMLPQDKRRKLKKLGLQANYIEILVSDKNRCEYFEEAFKLAQGKLTNPSKVLVEAMVNQKLDKKYPEPTGLVVKLLELLETEFASKEEQAKVVKEVVKEETDAVASYKKGKTQVLGYFVGQAQKKLRGSGDSKILREILIQELKH